MPSKKQATKAAAPGPALGFHEAYTHLLDGLPASVVEKVRARAEARGLDISTEDDYIVEILESSRGAYERKKASSRLAAARRRASKKSVADAALEAAVEPLEAAVEPLEAEAAPAEP